MDQTRQTLETQVLERAARDPQFRQQLKRDPRGTVARDFGVQIPPHITVETLEETSSKVYLVLPPAAAQRGQELSGHELESVAGGWSDPCTVASECGTCDPAKCTGNVECST